MQAKTVATGIIANPDTPQAYLVVEIAVSCPECGETVLRIPGHHLKTVRLICESYCDQFPALTGGRVTLTESHEFTTTKPARPEDN